MENKSCDVCKMDFKTPKLYQTHLITKRHTDRTKSEIKMYNCDCGKSYTQRQNMYRHRKVCKCQQKTVTIDPFTETNKRIKILNNR